VAVAGRVSIVIQDRHAGVVGMHDLAAEDARCEVLVEGHEQLRAVRDPVAQRLAGELDRVSREDVRLPVQWHVIGVLRRDDLGQEPRAGAALVDRLRRQRARDHGALARLARVLEPHVLDDEQRGGLVVELLARLLADLHEVRATGAARALGVG
jgi:hypothetical protein